ncbi:MAG: homoserine dehydrogenase [Pyrinomonadaceae bacterium]|nr:homoserine dehydrogenase [Pyrinomonadaceae bacterium]
MSKQITILKFGGSVLESERDLPRAVHEIYRHWRQGSQVLVVVSAFGGTTDRLLAAAESFSAEPNCAATASLLLTGEATSASLLGLELRRAGLPAKVLSAHQIGLVTRGERHDAEPVWADAARLKSELEHSIVIVSGFGGIDANGDPTLLGRGGSDYTALFLAERLDARCILVKDVAGLYDSDPAETGAKAELFETASYATAIRFGGPLIQEKSVRFAEQHDLMIELASLGSETGTTIGSFQDRLTTSGRGSEPPLRVALLGCGTVGGGVIERLAPLCEHFEIVAVANLRPERAIAAGVPENLIVSPGELLERESDVVVELVGGIDHARAYIRGALRGGRHVVTANKAVIARYGHEFEVLAAQVGKTIRYSAAVGGAMPALEAVSQEIGRIASVSGIVNGTCNFICSKLAEGIDLDDAVRLTQAAGFAEVDPTTDIDGTDAAQKLVLLARAAFGVDVPFDAIDRTGIEQLTPEAVRAAADAGKAIRLIAECSLENGKPRASVGPKAIPSEHPFARVNGADNCLLIRSQNGTEKFILARGAGRYATAESVIADLFDLRRQPASNTVSKRPSALFAEVGR